MSNKNSYFECQRCSYKCDQKVNMLRHLERKNICLKKFNAYKYTDDELYQKSVERTYVNPENNPNACSMCNKIFHTKDSLKAHIKKYCKKNDNTDNINHNKLSEINGAINGSINDPLHGPLHGPINDPINDPIKGIIKSSEINAETTSIIDSNNTNNSNNNNNNPATFTDSDQNIIDNSINKIDNSVNNINITIVNSFDEAWSTSHIDTKTKVLLLLNQCKFTATLENILENEVNLNVLIDAKSDNGIIYENNTIKNTTVKDIVSRTMQKIYKHLTDFKADAYTHNIDNGVIDSQIKLAGEKYDEFQNSKKVREKVNTCIKDIYCKKQTNAYDGIDKAEKDGY